MVKISSCSSFIIQIIGSLIEHGCWWNSNCFLLLGISPFPCWNCSWLLIFAIIDGSFDWKIKETYHWSYARYHIYVNSPVLSMYCFPRVNRVQPTSKIKKKWTQQWQMCRHYGGLSSVGSRGGSLPAPCFYISWDIKKKQIKSEITTPHTPLYIWTPFPSWIRPWLSKFTSSRFQQPAMDQPF